VRCVMPLALVLLNKKPRCFEAGLEREPRASYPRMPVPKRRNRRYGCDGCGRVAPSLPAAGPRRFPEFRRGPSFRAAQQRPTHGAMIIAAVLSCGVGYMAKDIRDICETIDLMARLSFDFTKYLRCSSSDHPRREELYSQLCDQRPVVQELEQLRQRIPSAPSVAFTS
jgi:hypothetical protein